MNDREKRRLMRQVAAWRRLAKRAVNTLERTKFCSTSLVRSMEPLRGIPVLEALFLQVLRWDCKVGLYLDGLRAAMASLVETDEPTATTHTTRQQAQPGRLAPMPA